MKHLLLALLLTAPVGAKDFGGYELTLGGGGVTVASQSAFGVDFTLSSNPIKSLPNLWLGVAQGVAWEPSFAGSSDVYADWNTHLFGDLYANTGWSVGTVYDMDNRYYRTGPEVTLQYYLKDNVFVYAGVNYDFNFGSKSAATDGVRYSVGLGFVF